MLPVSSPVESLERNVLRIPVWRVGQQKLESAFQRTELVLRL